jgi:hypothetical protein
MYMHPFILAQDWSILGDIPVSCKQDLELAHSDFILQLTTPQRITFVHDHPHRRRILRKFGGPIHHDRQWHNNEVWSMLLVHLDKECYEQDCLHHFTETLLCSYEYTEPSIIIALTISSAKMPFNLLLVLPESSALQNRQLLINLVGPSF